MLSDSYHKDWSSVYCPVCKEYLGRKKKSEIKTFECKANGCSQTEHTFFPGEIKRPGKSIPWASYHKDKKECGCIHCSPTDKP